MFDDKQLIKRAQKGDKSALSTLYDHCQPLVYRFVFYRVSDQAVAEDLTAEVFVSLIRHISSYKDQGRPFLAWVYTIAGNIVKMHYRRRQKREFVPLPEEMIDKEADPVMWTQSRLTHERLVAAMPHLTESQQQVILLKFVEGFTNAEVGMILGKTEGSIKSLQHRALAALRRVLVEEMHYESV